MFFGSFYPLQLALVLDVGLFFLCAPFHRRGCLLYGNICFPPSWPDCFHQQICTCALHLGLLMSCPVNLSVLSPMIEGFCDDATFFDLSGQDSFFRPSESPAFPPSVLIVLICGAFLHFNDLVLFLPNLSEACSDLLPIAFLELFVTVFLWLTTMMAQVIGSTPRNSLLGNPYLR